MQYNNNISLDLNGRATSKIVQVKQYDDDGRTLNIELLENGEPADISSSALITFRVVRPDGFSVVVSSAGKYVSHTTSSVSVVLKASMLSVAGNALADILITENGENLSSATFTLQINPAACRGDQIAESDFAVLQEILNSSEELISSMVDSVAAAEGFADAALLYATEAERQMKLAQSHKNDAEKASESATAAAAKLFNRVINQSDYENSTSLEPGIYFVKLGV